MSASDTTTYLTAPGRPQRLALIMALVGIDLFSDPAHVERARKELAERTGGKRYRSPLPASLEPPTFET